MGVSSSTSASETRPLRVWPIVVVLLLAVGLLDVSLRREQWALSPMQDRLAQAERKCRGVDRAVLLFGACLPAQVLRADSIGAAIDPGVRVVDLSAPGSFTLDWTLLLRNHVSPGWNVEAVVVAYEPRDLMNVAYLHESAMFQLAGWSDLPLLVSSGCEDPDCAADVALRLASPAHRQRGQTAFAVWNTLRTGRFEYPSIQPDGVSRRGLQASPFAESSELWARPRPSRATVPGSDRQLSAFEQRAVGREESAGQLGWRRGREWEGTPAAAARCLGQMVAAARARDIRVLFAELPRNPAAVPLGLVPAEQAALDEALAAITAAGGERLGPIGGDDLTSADFKDDVHASDQGRRRISAALGRAVATQLATSPPGVSGSP